MSETLQQSQHTVWSNSEYEQTLHMHINCVIHHFVSCELVVRIKRTSCVKYISTMHVDLCVRSHTHYT